MAEGRFSHCSESVIKSAATRSAKELGYTAMKPKQLEVVMGVLKGHDVFGVLPTGFGKSLCFASLPSIFDQLLFEEDSSIVLVITPLTAIMKDQVNLANYSLLNVIVTSQSLILTVYM